MSLEQKTTEGSPSGVEVRNIVRQAIEEFVRSEQRQAEPVYKAELQEERKRRESLEARVNQLVEENKRARAAADEADRHTQIRAELQRSGISKIDLAFKAIRDEIPDLVHRAHSAGAEKLEDFIVSDAVTTIHRSQPQRSTFYRPA